MDRLQKRLRLAMAGKLPTESEPIHPKSGVSGWVKFVLKMLELTYMPGSFYRLIQNDVSERYNLTESERKCANYLSVLTEIPIRVTEVEVLVDKYLLFKDFLTK